MARGRGRVWEMVGKSRDGSSGGGRGQCRGVSRGDVKSG